jgi:acyl carrier protein
VNRPDYAHIAKHLATAPDILAALRAEARGNDAVKTVAWESETEAALATIWSELLHVSLINPNDNFFDLGGHSLVVVLLIVRLREVLGVELPIEDVYSGDMTLRALARTIDRHKAGGDAEYRALVEEIERMSDDEVARLLAEESDAYPADL